MNEASPLEVRPPEAVQPTPEQVFALTLYRATPRVFVAYAMIAICLGIFIAMAVQGVSVMNPAPRQLQAWGANFPPLTGNGQWWRLVTSMFLHVGLIHLAVNMYALYNLGPIIERLFGNVGFFILYMLSGISGSLASYAFSTGGTSAGASGAIFGLFGGMLAFTVGQHGAVPPRFLASIRNNAILFGLINLGIGYAIPNVDNSAHLGGLAAGIVCGLILRKRFSPEVAKGRWLRNLLCTVLVSGSLVGWAISLPPNVFSEVQRIQALETRATQAFLLVVKDQETGKEQPELAQRVETEVLRPWREARERLNSLTRWPGQIPLETVKSYFRLREEGYELFARWLKEDDPALEQRAEAKFDESNELVAPFQQK